MGGLISDFTPAPNLNFWLHHCSFIAFSRAMLACDIDIGILSVRPSVRSSRSGIVS